MNASDLAVISGFHNKLIAEYGEAGIDAVGWLSNESQQARFRILAGLGDFTGKSLLDAGCGHADLFGYLANMYSNIHYTGIEQIPALLNVAIGRYGHLTNTQFLSSDFSEGALPATDYVIACGSLSYQISSPQYIFQMIEKLFSHCRIGFGFNLLSALKYPDAAIVSFDPGTILAFCNSLSSNVRFENRYWENDFTIMMYH